LMVRYREAKPNGLPTVTQEQQHILEDIRESSLHALTPLQRLEHALHPFVSLLVMPVFALCNAGFEINDGLASGWSDPVTLGVFLGLVVGKLIGVAGVVFLFYKLKWSPLPEGMNMQHVLGAGLLAGIGFTMSLFVAGLAFPGGALMDNAKLGIVSASLFSGILGYWVISKVAAKRKAG
ncbi:MAG: Na+/H+ antiporter NhaA, partial [Bacteroidota bacterium]